MISKVLSHDSIITLLVGNPTETTAFVHIRLAYKFYSFYLWELNLEIRQLLDKLWNTNYPNKEKRLI